MMVQTPNNMESHMIDIDITDTDVKINPDFYIHHAIVRAQQTFSKEDSNSGFLQFIIIVEHIESLCQAAKYLTDEYYEKLKEYMASEEHKSEEKHLIRNTRLANKKLNFILREVFDRRGSFEAMKI